MQIEVLRVNLEVAVNNEASALEAVSTLRLQMNSKVLEIIEKLGPITADKEALVIRVQAVVRGIRDRAVVERIRLSKKARDQGILIALKPTLQGDSGWYLSPDEQIYYFSLSDDDWNQVCGPLTLGDWQVLLRHMESQNPKKIKSMSSPFPHRVYGTKGETESQMYLIDNTSAQLFRLLTV